MSERSNYRPNLPDLATVTITAVDPVQDLDVIHGWVREERARFWGMTDKSRDEVGEIYGYLASLTTHHAYLVRRDGEPVALFQTYRPEADPVGECYAVQPGDFGIHLLLAPPRGAPRSGFTRELLRALFGFVLADRAVMRLVVDPDVRNEKAIARFSQLGFVRGPEVELPGKRAQLAFLPRAYAERVHQELLARACE